MHGHMILCLVVSGFVLIVSFDIVTANYRLNFDSYNKCFLTRSE